ncbi:hypothetical protein Poly59_05080 [Rubripirellula reticaptiva]|uniref:Secreted protein n=1 Tax=Rubripirellula reticaptiva TaxID=2528013 RepID=A0A5C6FDD6_9BACT|nr:hypothetical protein Poly59_05080 [Rubripirellula reticaptiva]
MAKNTVSSFPCHPFLNAYQVACIILAWSCFASQNWAAEQETDEDIKSIVDGAIAELTSVRDDVLKRYALMVQGESQTLRGGNIGGPPLKLDRIYKLQAGDKSSNFNYSSHCKVMDAGTTGFEYETQYWTEYLQCGTTTKARISLANMKDYKVRPEGQSIKNFLAENRLSRASFDPFDDLVLHVMFLKNKLAQRGWIEKVFLQECKFVSAERITNGDILSRWQWKQHSLEFEIELTQSKAYDLMPVRVKYVSKIKNMPKLFSDTEISWRKHATLGKHLPYRLKAASGGPFGNTQEYHHWIFDWRVGKEIDDDFFDCKADDFRIKFTPVFDFVADIYTRPTGVIPGTPWETPEEILGAEQAPNGR